MKFLCLLLLTATTTTPSWAFLPSKHSSHYGLSTVVGSRHTVSPLPKQQKNLPIPASSGSTRTTLLQMAAEDFNESKYTEAAWSLVSSLTKVADFYRASTVEAPHLLDVMLNPSKHNAGENAEAAQKVVSKTLKAAGVDTSQLRSDLEQYFSTQAKVDSGATQKVMGRLLQKVLDTARVGQSILGVREIHIFFFVWMRLLTTTLLFFFPPLL